jgi:spermidine synthase
MNATSSQRLTRLSLLGAITLLSGASALIFETLWTRAFGLMLGSTVQAAAAVFAAFLTALAAGAYVGGRWTASLRRPLIAYALLELGIGLTATAAGLALHWHGTTMAAWLRPVLEWNRAVAAYGSALIPVFVPTFLMGMTFPWIVTVARRFGGAVPLIYGLNTLGAALGTLACGFLFIRWLGIEKSLWLGGLLNFTSGALALTCLRLPSCAEDRADEDPTPGEPAQANAVVPETALLFATTVSGFVTLGAEIVWLRYGSYFLGNRTYAFSTLLATVLVLLALGSWLAGWLGRRRWPPNAVLGTVFLCSFAGVIFASGAVNFWIGRQDVVEPLLPGASRHLLLYRTLEAVLSLAPLLLPLGVLFPLTLTLARDSRRSLGPTCGRYYFLNTAGTVVGSVLTGFWGMTFFGANGWARLLALLCLLSAVLFFLLEAERGIRVLSRCGLALSAVGGCLLLSPTGPLQFVHSGERLIFRAEDEYGVLQIAGQANSHCARVSNNKTDLVFLIGSPETDYVQQMQGHLGMFYAPQARRVAVLGNGYGITAGAFSLYPTLERVDAVEILPVMMAVTSQFAGHNFNYFDDPRVRLIVDDGRHFLARASGSYDVISVNVSDPRLPGGSALFHKEFYDLAKSRLSKGGIVVQHVFGPQSRTAISTLCHCFRHVRLFPSYGNGYNVVASDGELRISEDQVARLASEPRVRAALASIGVIPPISPADVLRAGLDPLDCPALFDPNCPIATDNFPRIEFSWSDNGLENFHSND